MAMEFGIAYLGMVTVTTVPVLATVVLATREAVRERRQRQHAEQVLTGMQGLAGASNQVRGFAGAGLGRYGPG